MQTAAVILAVGRNRPTQPVWPALWHRLTGKPLVHYAVITAQAATGAKPTLLVEQGTEDVSAVVGEAAQCVPVSPQQGAADAVWQARLQVSQAQAVLVTQADMPLLTEAILQELVSARAQRGAVGAMLTCMADGARGFGRVLRDADGQPCAVIAEAACTPEQRAIREHDTGVYCFDAAWLWENLPKLPAGPDGRRDLGDLVGLAAAQGRPIEAVTASEPEMLLVVRSRVDLAEAEKLMRERINRHWMEAGVTMLDPDSTYIDADVCIGPDTVLLPNTYLWGETHIGSGCRIGPGTLIQDCQIGNNCIVTMSVLEEAVMEDGSDIGPFGHLRKGARLCRGAHMGNFGEMKNSTLGPGSKMGHFSYLGDATVGANVNIGAGTITCNFDGARKHPTVIEDDAFIGSDSMLVAPVRIGKAARTGAGSVVTHDVPAGAVVYGVPARVKRQGGEQ